MKGRASRLRKWLVENKIRDIEEDAKNVFNFGKQDNLINN
jgi:hypothetical protein